MRGAGERRDELGADGIWDIGLWAKEELELYRLARAFIWNGCGDLLRLAANPFASRLPHQPLEEARRASVVDDAVMNTLASEEWPVLRLDGDMVRPATVPAHASFPRIETAFQPLGVHDLALFLSLDGFLGLGEGRRLVDGENATDDIDDHTVHRLLEHDARVLRVIRRWVEKLAIDRAEEGRVGQGVVDVVRQRHESRANGEHRDGEEKEEQHETLERAGYGNAEEPGDKCCQERSAAEECQVWHSLAKPPTEVEILAEWKGGDVEDEAAVADAQVGAGGGQDTSLIPLYSFNGKSRDVLRPQSHLER